MSSKHTAVQDIAAPTKNAIVGGPFGSNLVSKDYVAEGVPVIRGQNMGNKWVGGEFVFVSDAKADELNPNKARPGDLVFTQRGTLGQVAIVPAAPYAEYIVSQSQMKLTPDLSKVDVHYLYYVFRSPEQQEYIRNAAIQTGVPHTNLGILKKTPILLPSLAAQRKIASVLSALDDRITLLRETNATLEAIAQAVFKSWFVDFEPVHAKRSGLALEGVDEATAELFPDRFEDSPLGEIPAGWRIARIEDIAEKIGMGPFGSNIKVSTFVHDGVPVLSGKHLQETLLEDCASNYITEAHAERLKNSLVRSGDVVLTHRGTLGQVSLIPEYSKHPSYMLSQSQFFLRCNESRMTPEWITYFLKSSTGQHLLLANASQVGVPSIARPVSYLRSIKLFLPSLDVLRKFSDVTGPLHEAIVANRNRIEALSSIRDGLLPRLISGQLRLPEVEEALAA